ncbi:MAG: TIGR02646 family protein [Gammaproteobacteria bacterium]|nr:TIGR02646 family protein [Gammaproteobacteria bacterium]
MADLRVEHFHPKSDNLQPITINWHLEWTNLLACCHGGSNSNVIDAAERHTSPDHSCDVPKGNHDWDNTILNPLHLPASPPAFKYQRIDGAIQVDEHNCGVAGVDPVKAQVTINYLRLDAERLRNLRKGELNRINDLLRKEIQNGLTVPEARKRLAEALLQKNDHHHWPKFFTAIRCYLGSAAEDQLRVIAFDG